MEWKHLAALLVGSALVTVGSLVPATSAILIPVGTTIIGGTLGIVVPRPGEKKP